MFRKHKVWTIVAALLVLAVAGALVGSKATKSGAGS